MLEQKSTKQAGLREKPTARSSLPSLVSRLDIVEIISEFIKVERRGKRLMALCPFHEDKDPSLQIDQERQLFYCFPCQKGGNLVTFLQRFNS